MAVAGDRLLGCSGLVGSACAAQGVGMWQRGTREKTVRVRGMLFTAVFSRRAAALHLQMERSSAHERAQQSITLNRKL